MKIFLILLCLISSSFAVNYDELYGNWQIMSLKDNNKKVFFSGEFDRQIDVEFNTNLKVNLNSQPTRYYFQLQNNTLLIGKYIRDGKLWGSMDSYEFDSLVSPELSRGMTCYILKPIKLSMGGIKTKNQMKICREKKSILEKYKY